jgi:hypothetical protein
MRKQEMLKQLVPPKIATIQVNCAVEFLEYKLSLVSQEYYVQLTRQQYYLLVELTYAGSDYVICLDKVVLKNLARLLLKQQYVEFSYTQFYADIIMDALAAWLSAKYQVNLNITNYAYHCPKNDDIQDKYFAIECKVEDKVAGKILCNKESLWAQLAVKIEAVPKLIDNLDDCQVAFPLEVGELTLTNSQLNNLEVGDIVLLNHSLITSSEGHIDKAALNLGTMEVMLELSNATAQVTELL